MKKLPTSAKREKEFLDEAETQRHPLSEWVRRGAQLLLQRGLELEVTAFLGRGPYQRCRGNHTGYRNGYEGARVMTGEGSLVVHKPQVRGCDAPFQSEILPAFTRRSENLDQLMSALYVRGLNGNAGVIRTVRECLPSSLRQRCQVHKMRNVLAKLPRRVQGGMKGMLQRIFTAVSYGNALRRGKELIARYQDSYPEAMACLEKDLEECLICLRFPAEHRKRIRTTNLLERLLGEGRRRTKVIPHCWSERSCLTLVYATLLRAAKNWRGVRITPVIQQKLADLWVEYQPAIEQAVA